MLFCIVVTVQLTMPACTHANVCRIQGANEILIHDIADFAPCDATICPIHLLFSFYNTSRYYLKKYAHNEPGTYTSTEKAAPDAGLIFATSKSSCAKLLEQVKKVAFGSEHAHSPFPITEVAAGGVSGEF